MAKDTTPIEEFRRVTATTMRAVSAALVRAISVLPDAASWAPEGATAATDDAALSPA